MRVSMIAALDEKGGIGMGGRLPWRLPDDLKRFKQLTLGHHILMGRKTYATIGRPLPGRTTIVITRQENYRPEGCLTTNSLEAALGMAQNKNESEVFICGGGEIYTQGLIYATRMYLTRVHATVAADVYFPAYAPAEWVLEGHEAHPADERHAFAFTFEVWGRKTMP
jgi:dihydrofolate reductase